MAYLRLAVSLNDDIALERVINVPKRGLGDVSLTKLATKAEAMGMSTSQLLFGAPDDVDLKSDAGVTLPDLPPPKELGLSQKAAAAVEEFRQAVAGLRQALLTQPLDAALQHILGAIDYESHVLKGGCGGKEGDEADRIARLKQLLATAAQFTPGTAGTAALAALDDTLLSFSDDGGPLIQPNMPTPAVTSSSGASTSSAAPCGPAERLALARAFMDEAALYSGLEEDADVGGVRLMTMHAAKGLEFDVVFVPGCVEGLVPLFDPARGDSMEDLDEETRLFFVSMTRAKRDLRLLHTRQHVLHGVANRRPNTPSRYLKSVAATGHAETIVLGAYDEKSNGAWRHGGRGSRDKADGKGWRGVRGASVADTRSKSDGEWFEGEGVSRSEDGAGWGNRRGEFGKKEIPTPPLTRAQLLQKKRTGRR